MTDFSNKDIESVDQIAPLIQKFLNGEPLSEKELAVLENWKNLTRDNYALFQKLNDPDFLRVRLATWHEIEKNRETNKIRGLKLIEEMTSPAIPSIVTGDKHRVHFLRRGFLKYAAAILLIFGTAAYFWNKDKTYKIHEPLAANVAAPKSLLATITLSNGKTIALDSVSNGPLAQEGNIQIKKNKDGSIIYSGINAGEILYNTISVPRGSKIASLILSDGTKIWLNSASSVRYPVVFAANKRVIEIEGEAYVDVAKNAGAPFYVQMENQSDIEVLGTEFNVNGYTNEKSAKTTLFEGSVKVNIPGKEPKILKPGQQAEIKNGNIELNIINEGEAAKIRAWRDGFFNFDNASIDEVMRQIERWYDIEVIYEKGIPAIHFVGEISRNTDMSDMLTFLEKAHVRFRLEGRKLIVLP